MIKRQKPTRQTLPLLIRHITIKPLLSEGLLRLLTKYLSKRLHGIG